MKFGKKQANKKLRTYLKQGKEISNGNCYKKVYSNYEIYEYKHHITKQEIINEWYEDQAEVLNNINSWKSKWLAEYTLDKAILHWYLSYKRK